MPSYYSTRTAYNSFLVNTVPVSDDYTVSITQTGTMFLIDASTVGGGSLDISLPSPSHAGMYFKFVFTTQSARIVNIQLQDDTASFVGLVIKHVNSGDPDVDATGLSANFDRMEFNTGQRPGSWIEIVSTGTQGVAHGHHFGAAHAWRNDT